MYHNIPWWPSWRPPLSSAACWLAWGLLPSPSCSSWGSSPVVGDSKRGVVGQSKVELELTSITQQTDLASLEDDFDFSPGVALHQLRERIEWMSESSMKSNHARSRKITCFTSFLLAFTSIMSLPAPARSP
jgi:hypothetical protein